MKFLHSQLILFFLSLALGMGCKFSKTEIASNKRPDWVQQRPTNTQYYVGIGYASKLSNSADFQRVAKKNALDDMIGEIKVTVSSNSILSQYQNNQNFSQQFYSDTRMIATETMEGFQVMDSWENKSEYWIYYRMNKLDFEAYKRKKLYEAIDKALDFMYRADNLDAAKEYVQKFKLRSKALSCLQGYLNESIEATYRGKNVYLLNELVSQVQDQLFLVRINPKNNTLLLTNGKGLDQAIEVVAGIKNKDSILQAIPNLPLKIENNAVRFRGNTRTETQNDGSAQFAISGIQSKDPIQVLQIKIDLERLLRGDSLNGSMKKLLLSMDGPMANIRAKIEPIKIYMQDNELNLDKKMAYPILEPALKKKLMEQGCSFVSNLDQADYILELEANTKDQGVMWGSMLKCSIEMSLILKDAKSKNELFRDAKGEIMGFQTTTEKAGIEAYLTLRNEMMNRLYPNLENRLFASE